MSEIRKADPEARRRAILVVVLGAAVGGLLIAGFEELRKPFHDWLMSNPEETAWRAKLAMSVSAVVLSAPVIAFAVYLWLLGARVLRTRQFPPPGFRVVRDTPVAEGQGAVTRGHALQVLAVCLALGAAVLCLFFWWLTSIAGTVTQARRGAEQGPARGMRPPATRGAVDVVRSKFPMTWRRPLSR